MIDAIVLLLKRWKELALKLDREAENETGIKREQLRAMAQALYGCEEDLRSKLEDEFLALADILVEAIPQEHHTPEQVAKRQAYIEARKPYKETEAELAQVEAELEQCGHPDTRAEHSTSVGE